MKSKKVQVNICWTCKLRGMFKLRCPGGAHRSTCMAIAQPEAAK